MIKNLRMAVVFLLTAVAPAAAIASSPISGRWYSEGVEHDAYFQFFDEYHDDGTFTLEGREIRGCKPGRPWTESGEWTYANGVLLKWTKIVAGRAVPDTEEYHDKFVVAVGDGDHQQWLDAKTKVTWSVSHVSPEFRFPVPAPCATTRLPQ